MKAKFFWTYLAALAAAMPAFAQEPIKIGVTQPLTGAFAASGNYVACVTHTDAAESGGSNTFRVRVNHLTGANASTTVYARCVVVER